MKNVEISLKTITRCPRIRFETETGSMKMGFMLCFDNVRDINHIFVLDENGDVVTEMTRRKKRAYEDVELFSAEVETKHGSFSLKAAVNELDKVWSIIIE